MSTRLLFTISLISVFLACVIWSCNQSGEKRKEKPPGIAVEKKKYIDPLSCKPCHTSIVDQYFTSGKGRSFYNASIRYVIENWKVNPVYDEASNLFYLPYRVDSSFYIREFRLEGIDTIHKRSERIAFFIGSGNQTRSYLFQRNGYLYEIPITWYSKKKIWDLSPGYEQGNNQRFDRLVGRECMECHNSGFENVPNSINRYTDFGHSIACESCHGPIENHLKQATQSKSKNHTDILRLSATPVQVRLDVCRQCHLEGIKVRKKNAKPGEYEPGKLLSDFSEVFIPTMGESSDFGFASHAERLQQSRCFIVSDGKMTCTTCHDPHGAAPKDKINFYNQKCRSCHESGHEKSCSKTKDMATADCKSCHMHVSGTSDIPHVNSTDHLIRKQLKRENIPCKSLVFKSFTNTDFNPADLLNAKLAYAESKEKGELFADIKQYMNQLDNESQLKFYYLSKEPWQNLLDTGSLQNSKNPWTLFYWSQLKLKAGLPGGLGDLEKACEMAPDMIDFQYQLATAFDKAGLSSAGQYKKVLLLNPLHEKSLTNVGFDALVARNYLLAEKHFTGSLTQNPDFVLNLENLARCYMEQGNFRKAKVLLSRLQKRFPNEIRYQKVMESMP